MFVYGTEVLMVRLMRICFMLAFTCGCSDRYFTNLGNGVGVPTESIEEYAESNGISRDEARKRMLDESNRKKQIQDGN